MSREQTDWPLLQPQGLPLLRLQMRTRQQLRQAFQCHKAYGSRQDLVRMAQGWAAGHGNVLAHLL